MLSSWSCSMIASACSRLHMPKPMQSNIRYNQSCIARKAPNMSLPDCQPGTGCPPHHWLIKEPRLRLSLWTCLRCGAQQEHERPTTKRYRHSGRHWRTQTTSIAKPDCEIRTILAADAGWLVRLGIVKLHHHACYFQRSYDSYNR